MLLAAKIGLGTIAIYIAQKLHLDLPFGGHGDVAHSDGAKKGKQTACALYANLSITARTCHMFPVSYLSAGLDATVSWGGPEFKFVNSRSYPIKIVAYVQNGSVTVELWGTDVDGSYVEMLSSTSSTANGYNAVTTRNVYAKDGTLISSKTEAYSSYSYHTSEPEATAAPTESPQRAWDTGGAEEAGWPNCARTALRARSASGTDG